MKRKNGEKMLTVNVMVPVPKGKKIEATTKSKGVFIQRLYSNNL